MYCDTRLNDVIAVGETKLVTLVTHLTPHASGIDHDSRRYIQFHREIAGQEALNLTLKVYGTERFILLFTVTLR